MSIYQIQARTMKSLPLARYEASSPEEALALHVAATEHDPVWLAVPDYAKVNGPSVHLLTEADLAREEKAAAIRAANRKVDRAMGCSGERGSRRDW